MFTASEIRQKFLDFFKDKGHKIVASAPIVNKNDPSLMFTNAGMNQFKDFFLGNKKPSSLRIADSQKCLRVSGKHNDLEEVGIDSYHHTMFEMLGNWSFGDYFKKDAISWAWELLTEVYKLDKDRLYVSIFEGSEEDGVPKDTEAIGFWKAFIPEDRILEFDKADNFWEMGDVGPCGPCSEIHIDLRSDEERKKVSGKSLVNKDHPLVVEIWNLVFIQFNRKANGKLENLANTHVDTGMGFERLCMAVQKKKSNYDTDVFSKYIQFLEKKSKLKYTFNYDLSAKSDIAMRVVVDHIRAVAFTIADGQLPSNTGAGYVIRRILRRAVRYYYSFLNIKEPLLHQLIPILANDFKDIFPELKLQEKQVEKIIYGEEVSFLKTLENGLKRFDQLKVKENVIDGEVAFELYDTFGFPIDLTRLLASEKGWEVDEVAFKSALKQQKDRSRSDAEKSVGDWIVFSDDESKFVGYDALSISNAKIIKIRTVATKKGKQFQIVLDQTPFYGESGGQRGDIGIFEFNKETIKVLDTQKENDLTIHIVDKLPNIDGGGFVNAKVQPSYRKNISSNHSAAHIMHSALHEVLGKNSTQKGQDVDNRRLRFDFAHFQKVTPEEIVQIEHIVNEKIRANIKVEEQRTVPIEEARKSGALMLFGEKYGEEVRIITIENGFSKELCGGTHVGSTGELGLFKITSESSVATGIRRIEAITGEAALKFYNKELSELNNIRNLFKNPQSAMKAVSQLMEEVKILKLDNSNLLNEQVGQMKSGLISEIELVNDVKFIGKKINLSKSDKIKDLAYQIEKEVGDIVICFGAIVNGKPNLTIIVSKSLVESNKLHAGNMIRAAAKLIQGGGGGQPFFATAGGKNMDGLEDAIREVKSML